ncbi:MAG: exo-alpha-sialidase, partial [Stackebrandtia sp.]
QAFTPSVHVAADGTVGVTYYDFRNNTPAPQTLPTDYFLVHCHPANPASCTDPANWADEVQVTDESFDMRLAPFALGFFTGDYEGLSSIGDAFTPFFSQSHGTDPSSTFFRTVG